ncbi:MAG: hypothetical protein QOI22_911, partial [Verrucomicrobiota bacterium]
SSAGAAAALLLRGRAVIFAMLKAGRKSGVVLSTALKKEKDPPSESVSDGSRKAEEFSALKIGSLCCANKGRQRLRNPATADSARLAMDNSQPKRRERERNLENVHDKGARRRRPSLILHSFDSSSDSFFELPALIVNLMVVASLSLT